DPAEGRASVHAARRTLVRSLGIAAATGATVALAGGGEAVWACVPAALLAASAAGRLLGAALSAAAVLAAALAGELSPAGSGRTEPRTVLVALVAAASVAILLAMRERLERERDALRASALSDPLTGVANRRALLERIEYEIARHERRRR